ncbi:metallophosphoesterase [Enterococcus pallens]|uniref:Calcineurin-like phosphoesterase domain-containing protein n=1 Tax=Enterococcus pallens ATCC BAA-351 TaxID=1158607 RepID=R2QHW3_9ENTE|nr:hypothetical protein UAU_01705 [Enterococcus pallens ATCC BAA-351]EOU14898.1 hypothetical protein I588_04548 [Enterococcus pallens ATCC BAA-351]OJG78157.1 hypothetical protein RV10_GL001645 [Enterococcus pallens]
MKEQKWKRFMKVWHITLVMGLLMGTAAPVLGLAEEMSSQASSQIEETATSSTSETKASQTAKATTETTTAADEKKTAPKAAADDTGTKKITILGTSDVHGQLWNYSYEDKKETPVGLAQVSSAVQAARSQNQNGTVLIDNGDMVQGTILTDDLYNTKEGYKDKAHPMIKAMNYMKYDAMVLGNHEFNFGLPLIEKIKSEASFPILSANTYKKADGSNFVGSTTIKELDFDGDSTTDLKVGVIGLTMPVT